MTTIDDLAIEMVNAKEQLKSINNTINKDRKIVSDLEKGIEEKNKEIKKLEKEIEEKNDEIASLDSTKNKAEEEYGAIRDNLKAEIKKLNESKKKDEEKYQIMVEELSNDVKVLTNRKQELKLTINDLEDEIRKTRADRDNEVALKDREIKEVKEKLDNFNLLFDEQDGKYRKTAREIEDMNKKLEEKDGLIAEC
jgi:chromosome segregation ATPase